MRNDECVMNSLTNKDYIQNTARFSQLLRIIHYSFIIKN